MKTIEKVFLALSLTITIIVLAFIITKNSQVAYGSVSLANDYHSTSTRVAITGVAYTQLISLQGTTSSVSGTFGSIVITGANTGTINVYDATSTNSNSQYGTTTLASIPASAAAGTYTFDSQYYRGLVIEVIGLAPTSTVTYR